MNVREPKPRRSRPRPMPHRRPAVEALEGRSLMSYGGSPDLSFGTLGRAPYVLPASTDNFTAAASAVQPDGKVVVVGYLDVITNPLIYGGKMEFAAARYNADGTLDTSFGTSGYFTSPMLAGVFSSTLSTLPISARAVANQPDGKIVVVGDDGGSAAAVRLNSDGTLDTSFGTAGIVDLNDEPTGSPQLQFADSVAILPGGQILLGGVDEPTVQSYSLAVEELNADGSLASTFGVGGQSLIPAPNGTYWSPGFTGFQFSSGSPDAVAGGLAVLPDGEVDVVGNVDIAGGMVDDAIVASRLTAGGLLDSAYGFDGQALLPSKTIFPTGVADGATAVAVQPDGKLVIGGSFTYQAGAIVNMTHLLALRLTTQGALDPTFGIGGANIVGGIAPGGSTVGALAIQGDGKIVLADLSFPDTIRLLADGLPDFSFGQAGTAFTVPPEGPPPTGSVGLAVLPDGKLLEARGFGDVSGNALVRLLDHGAVNDYGDTGVTDPTVLITDKSIFAAEFPGGNTGAGEVVQFGQPGFGSTLPAPGAYDGGGVSELAGYLPSLGVFAVRPYGGGADVFIAVGQPGPGRSLPAEGDYDGLGRTEYAVYEPGPGLFVHFDSLLGTLISVPMTVPGYGQTLPAPGDYFGYGRTDYALYQNGSGIYAVMNPNTGQVTDYNFAAYIQGEARDTIPAPGNYDGAGHDEPAIYLPDAGKLVYMPAGGGAPVVLSLGFPSTDPSIAAPGDYDGSGHTEAAAYDPNAGTLAYLPADGGPVVTQPFGSPEVSIPFALGATTLGPPAFPGVVAASVLGSATAEIPLTPDVLATLAGPMVKKKS